MEGYSIEIELEMIGFFESLGERDRRRYAAIEASKLGHSGIAYISRLLGCDPKTIQQGKAEIKDPQTLKRDARRQRKKTAAARKRKLLRHKLSKTSGKS